MILVECRIRSVSLCSEIIAGADIETFHFIKCDVASFSIYGNLCILAISTIGERLILHGSHTWLSSKTTAFFFPIVISYNFAQVTVVVCTAI